MAPAAAKDSPFPLTDTDRWVLAQTDGEYVLHDWANLKTIIDANDLAILRRKPSDLRRYMKWTADTKAEYGSITNYLIAHRLPKAWGSPPYVPTSTTPFAHPSDYQVLLNDWPYGLTPDVTHMVVWTRTMIPTDSETGDMTPESRARVAGFVKRIFTDQIDAVEDGGDGDSRVLWFKNWAQLQSVRQLEHVHVLVRNASPELLKAWTAEPPCHTHESNIGFKRG
ncbi:hypothetical protein CMQ_2655 [Grosmannia clavigera kw1407]|uniref:N-acetylglucosamine-induced protein 1 n=1 Tax=Grosmannia clavigera (strain kw1407 / UAMH 11150) TaxID=655863 RepID=F0XGY7_GROCL|nr:uncharacterized protein CMQ_2655 [Grosmannia clavigera kw1407]EFX02726.1 hypothetical protein CMQ_2655 [Grosmannia clavigera kw1407]